MKNREQFTALLKWLIIYTLIVIVWGAWVRISHSGDGCGDTWPLCKGVLIPEAERGKTWVEYLHRLTSGLFGIVIVYMYIQSRNFFSAEHPVRRWALLALIFTVTEALLGAKLVLFKLVGSNDSPFRAFAMSLHLINSLTLTACIFLTYDFSRIAENQKWTRAMGAKLNLAFFKNNQKSAIALITAFFILGITGAIAALANTLYPSDSILSGLLEDFSAEAHYLIRLRTWHPLVGGLIGGGIGLIAKYISDFNENSHESKMRGYLLSLMAFSGVGIGITTLLSLSPFTLKIIHLLWGHLIWLSLVAWLRTFFWERPVNFQPLIIYFDGVCNLCNFAVDYIHSAQLNLKAKVFLFAPLQGKTAQSELSLQDRGDHGQEPKSIVVKLEKRTLTESTAVMEILRRLDFKNFILSLLMELIPRPLRDIAYKFIAKNRYLFFGKKDSCRLPTAEEKQYFLD